MYFEIVGNIGNIETIATSTSIRELSRLRAQFGLNVMNHTIQFAICIHNQDCEDLDLLKVYEVLPDAEAWKEDLVRVVDESGEDYLYPQKHFVFIHFAPQIEQSLLNVIHQNKISA